MILLPRRGGCDFKDCPISEFHPSPKKQIEQAQREAKLATGGKWVWWVPSDEVIYLSISEAIAQLCNISSNIEFEEFCEILQLQPKTDNLPTHAAWKQFKAVSQAFSASISPEQGEALLFQISSRAESTSQW